MIVTFIALALVSSIVLYLWIRERQARRAADAEAGALRSRFAPVLDADAEAVRIRAEIAAEAERARKAEADFVARRDAAARESAGLAAQIAALGTELAGLEEQENLLSVGFYKPHYDFDTSERYRQEEEAVRARQAAMIKAGRAAVCDTVWHVGGSQREGKKMIDQTLRLVLRAFNGECDAAISRVRYNNVGVMQTRIRKAFDAINKAVTVQQCRITREYLDLKCAELFLAHEYQEKLQEEKEEQRRIREQMREEEIARREYEKAQADAAKEEQRYASALDKARQEVSRAEGARQEKLLAQIGELELRLAEAHERKERAIARAQMTRSGHVYVISNIGSFGEHVYKIGMTRRLDPMDRIRELGDASVPFQFDVHAIIYSEDAPALEAALHRLFKHRRVNRVNERKEFFHVPIGDIAQAVRANHGEIELTLLAEAEEFRKTLAALREEIAREPHRPEFVVPVHWAVLPGQAAAVA